MITLFALIVLFALFFAVGQLILTLAVGAVGLFIVLLIAGVSGSGSSSGTRGYIGAGSDAGEGSDDGFGAEDAEDDDTSGDGDFDDMYVLPDSLYPEMPQEDTRGFTDEEILGAGLYPDDEAYEMHLISKILDK